MGAKHPEQVLSQLRCNKNEFILAATYLVRSGVCKNGPDAIRYMEQNNLNVGNIIDELIESKRSKPPATAEENDTSTESSS